MITNKGKLIKILKEESKAGYVRITESEKYTKAETGLFAYIAKKEEIVPEVIGTIEEVKERNEREKINKTIKTDDIEIENEMNCLEGVARRAVEEGKANYRCTGIATRESEIMGNGREFVAISKKAIGLTEKPTKPTSEELAEARWTRTHDGEMIMKTKNECIIVSETRRELEEMVVKILKKELKEKGGE